MPVPYTFATATAPLPLSQLDANFATAITLGSTSLTLGSTVTSVAGLTLTSATISSLSSALSVANGGTGLTSLTTGYIPYGNGTSAFSSSSSFIFNGTNFAVGLTAPYNATTDIGSFSKSYAGLSQVLIDNQTSTGAAGLSFSAYGGGWTVQVPGSATFVNPLIFKFGSTEMMRISSSGNVGIGTSSPFADTGYKALHINGTSTGSEINLSLSGTVYGQIVSNATTGLVLNSTTTPMTFFNAGSERMRIDTSGNVGIGTSSPSYPLDVIQDQNAATYTRVRNNYAGSSAYAGVIVNAYGNQWAMRMGSAAANSNALQFVIDPQSSNVTLMTLDTSGNLGLGVTPSAWGVYKAIELIGGANFSASNGNLQIVYNAYYNGANWIYKTTNPATNYTQFNGQHYWQVAPSGTAGNAITFTQAMTLDNSGNLLVGTTTSGGVGYTLLYNASGPTWINNWSVDGGTHASFRTAGVQKGYIATSGGVTIYSTTSDERAKENIEPSASALQSILDTEIVSFDFKDKSGHTNYGGIAQRLLNTIPETIFVPKNPDEMMGVDWSKAVPRLIKSIQEQQAIIESLTQRIATLENK